MSQTGSQEKKVIVLGAGMIGSAIAHDLAAESHLRVHLADSKPESLARARSRAPVETHVADLASAGSLRSLLEGCDLAVGALPSVLGLHTVKAGIEAGCDVVDISFMSEDARLLDSLAREQGVTVVTDCGVAPGLTNMVAAFAATRFDTCERIEMAVGGLPAIRKWPFSYKAGFAPWDVLEEYTRPARVVENGQVVMKEALSELQLVDIPGVGTLESSITDGLRSLVDTLKVPYMEERTLRWPGHTELMKAFRATGYFSLDPIRVGEQTVRPRDVTAALLFPKWTFDEGEADLTIVRVRASGLEKGSPKTLAFDCLDRFDVKSGLRSMSRSTGFTATAVASLVLDGTFSVPGVHAPEALGARPGLLERVVEYLRVRGIRCEMTEAS